MDNRRRAMDRHVDRHSCHTPMHSPDRKPVTHKLHSYYCYYPLPSNEKDSAAVLQK